MPHRRFRLAFALSLAVALAACNVQRTGLDARLDMKAEPEYRKSLAVAWKDMTTEQKEAFNWAVSDMDLYTLMAAYPEGTPRQVISAEADKEIQAGTRALAEATARYTAAEPTLAQQEKQVEEITAELRKLTAGKARLEHRLGDRKLRYTSTNNSRYDISSASWTAWVFVDGEEKTTRKMSLTASYGHFLNGLRQGGSGTLDASTFFNDDMHTPEIRSAKSVVIQMELDPTSVRDLGERRILPSFETNRADHVRRIDASKSRIDVATKHKGTLG